MPAVTENKKTPAKRRYLKRKKERKKQRKVATREAGSTIHDTEANAVNEDTTEDEDPATDSEGSTEEAEENEHEDDPPIEEQPSEITLERKTKRKKKRRRPDEEDTSASEDSAGKNEDVEMHAAEGDEDAAMEDLALRESPQPDTEGLPSFPRPIPAAPPSKIELAQLGLDRHILGALIIEPSRTLPLDHPTFRLHEKTLKCLKDQGIDHLFAVQTALLPILIPEHAFWRRVYRPYNPPRDVCVSAPTGSGKTLGYVLPLIEILSTRVVTRLRALIILPTRDLVAQVRETFEVMGKGRNLKIATATGQHSFGHEQSQIIADMTSKYHGGSSKIDILICTPGRLIDHIQGTPNFTLQHLRFLVIDEADRLLSQSYNDWLAQVLAALNPPVTKPRLHDLTAHFEEDGTLRGPDTVAPGWLDTPDATWLDVAVPAQSSCQKLLFSATLTRDPGRLAALSLRDPQYVIVQGDQVVQGDEAFAVPESLKEHMIVCMAAQKPLVLYHLVVHRSVRFALVFTKSTEATLRLVQLLDFMFAESRDKAEDVIVIKAYSSDLPPSQRKTVLDDFKSGRVHILVSSDLIGRGLDVPHVAHVVSYDAPVDLRKYVHRVGRTARAGREGNAWTLVEEQEARWFKNMMSSVQRSGKVKRIRLTEADLSPFESAYENALEKLKELYVRS